MKKLIGSLLTIGLFAFAAVGGANAQANIANQAGASASADITANIDVFDPITLSSTSESIDFGDIVVGGDATVAASQGASFQVTGGDASIDGENAGVSMVLSWNDTSVDFDGAGGMSWNPDVEIEDSGNVGDNTASASVPISSGDVVQVGGTVENTDDTDAGEYSATLTLTVEYTGS